MYISPFVVSSSSAVNHQYQRPLTGEAVFERAEFGLHHTPIRRYTFLGCSQVLSVVVIDPDGAQDRVRAVSVPALAALLFCRGTMLLLSHSLTYQLISPVSRR